MLRQGGKGHGLPPTDTIGREKTPRPNLPENHPNRETNLESNQNKRGKVGGEKKRPLEIDRARGDAFLEAGTGTVNRQKTRQAIAALGSTPDHARAPGSSDLITAAPNPAIAGDWGFSIGAMRRIEMMNGSASRRAIGSLPITR